MFFFSLGSVGVNKDGATQPTEPIGSHRDPGRFLAKRCRVVDWSPSLKLTVRPLKNGPF